MGIINEYPAIVTSASASHNHFLIMPKSEMTSQTSNKDKQEMRKRESLLDII